MPSCTIHNICGLELIKKLKLSNNQKKDFIIGNILPDVNRVKNFKDLSDKEKRMAIQERKKISHFRTNFTKILEYPNCHKFLSLYENDVKKNIVSLAYFFHLFTDRYYFKFFLPKFLTFYTENMEETLIKRNVMYVMINKTMKVYPIKELFNKDNEISIYREYTRATNYLVNKYNIKMDYDELFDYIDECSFKTNVKESNSFFAYYAVIKLRKYNKLVSNDGELQIFTEEQLGTLVDDVISSFIKEYGYLLSNYR